MYLQKSANEQVEAWGSAIGESLVTGDLAALIAHKRATVQQASSGYHSCSASRGILSSDQRPSNRSALLASLHKNALSSFRNSRRYKTLSEVFL